LKALKEESLTQSIPIVEESKIEDTHEIANIEPTVTETYSDSNFWKVNKIEFDLSELGLE
jgi:hypothetical protein